MIHKSSLRIYYPGIAWTSIYYLPGKNKIRGLIWWWFKIRASKTLLDVRILLRVSLWRSWFLTEDKCPINFVICSLLQRFCFKCRFIHMMKVCVSRLLQSWPWREKYTELYFLDYFFSPANKSENFLFVYLSFSMSPKIVPPVHFSIFFGK